MRSLIKDRNPSRIFLVSPSIIRPSSKFIGSFAFFLAQVAAAAAMALNFLLNFSIAAEEEFPSSALDRLTGAAAAVTFFQQSLFRVKG